MPVHIRRFPNEILSEIFLATLPKYPKFPELAGPSSPVILGHICREWRAVSLSTPALWCALRFDLDSSHADAQAALLALWLSRARALPVSIGFFSPRDETLEEMVPDVVRFLAILLRGHSSQLQNLILSVPLCGNTLRLLQSTSTPRLERLQICSHVVEPQAERILLFPHAPRLHSLKLNQDLRVTCDNLTTLVVFDIAYTVWTNILRLATATLVHCEVSTLDVTEMTDLRLATHPIPPLTALHSLVFSGRCKHTTASTGLLSALTLPVLRRLEMPEVYFGEYPVRMLAAFIRRSGCDATLTYLNVMPPTNERREYARNMYRQAFGRVGRLIVFSAPCCPLPESKGVKDWDMRGGAGDGVTVDWGRERRVPAPGWEEDYDSESDADEERWWVRLELGEGAEDEEVEEVEEEEEDDDSDEDRGDDDPSSEISDWHPYDDSEAYDGEEVYDAKGAYDGEEAYDAKEACDGEEEDHDDDDPSSDIPDCAPEADDEAYDSEEDKLDFLNFMAEYFP
ncbi:hypothetical protein C8R46DRAFT_1268567 [Mycena filopes]|nr:hypothetical protein C8R46DRAFT_1268567 [Mycena filopes]